MKITEYLTFDDVFLFVNSGFGIRAILLGFRTIEFREDVEIRNITVEAIEPPRIQEEPNLPLHIKHPLKGSQLRISNGRLPSTLSINQSQIIILGYSS